MKKMLALIAVTMVAGLLMACGGSDDMSSPPADTNSAAGAAK